MDFEVLERVVRQRRTIKPGRMNGKKIAEADILGLIQLADWAPTHGRTEPWRFVVLEGEAFERFSQQHAELYRSHVPAEKFREDYHFPAQVCLNLFGSRDAVVSYASKKTNPTIRVYGSDENFVDQNGFTVAYGRALNNLDVSSGRNVCLLGSEIAKKLFGNLEKPLDNVIRVNNIPYRIVGTLNEKGSSLGFSWDNVVVTSYKNVQRFFNSNPNASFNIQIKVNDIRYMDAAIGEATAAFRPIRRLTTTEAENFVIDKSDSFVEMLLKKSWPAYGSSVGDRHNYISWCCYRINEHHARSGY